MDKIKTYVYAEFLYFLDRTFCFNFGWYTTKVLMNIKTAMSFKDCYKNILYTILDYTNWYGPTALWIDQCDNSNDEDVTIIQYSPSPVDKAYGQYFFGDGTKSKCWPGFVVADNHIFGNMLHNFISSYLLNTKTESHSEQ